MQQNALTVLMYVLIYVPAHFSIWYNNYVTGIGVGFYEYHYSMRLRSLCWTGIFTW